MARGADKKGRGARALRAAVGWVAAVVAALGIAVAVAVAGAVAVSWGWGRTIVVALVEANLGDALGTPVRIEALRGPLYPRFEATGVRIGEPGHELARARRIAVRWDLGQLFRQGPLVVEEVEIEGLSLVLRHESPAGWNLPAHPAAAATASGAHHASDGLPFAVSLKALHVADSQIDLAWTSPGSSGALVGGFEGRVQDVLLPPGTAPATWGAGDLTLTLEHGELGTTHVARGALEATLDPSHFLQLTSVLAGGFGELGISGRGDLDAWLAGRGDPQTRVDVAFDALDVAALLGRQQPDTRLVGRAQLGVGPRTAANGAPELLVDVALEPSRLGRVPIERGHLSGSLLDRAWRVETLSLSGDGLSVSGSSEGTFSDVAAVDLQAQVEHLERLSSWLPQTVEGQDLAKLAGSVSLALHLAEPLRGADGRVALDGRHLAWGDLARGDVRLDARVEKGRRAVVERLSVQGALRGEDVSFAVAPGAALHLAGAHLADGVVVERLQARSGAATLDVDGRLDPQAMHALHLRLAGLEPTRFGALEGIATPTAGRIDADVTLDGPLATPDATGWLALHAGAARIPALGETFAPIDARLRLADGTLFVDRLTVGPPGQQARVSGRVAVPGLRPGRADLRLQVADFPLTRVPLPGGASEPVSEGPGTSQAAAAPTSVATGGHVDADLRVTGPLLAPAVTGDLDWTRPRWQNVELDRLTLHLEGDARLVMGSLAMRYQGSEILQARASLPVPAHPRRPVDWLHEPRAHVEVTGDDLDFALLAPFLTRLVRDPRGRADVKLVIDGGLPEPRVDGLVTVADGSLRVPLLRQTFAPVSGRARFDGRRVSLESLQIGRPEAGLFAEGDLELSDLRPSRIDLGVRLTAFPISRSSLLAATVDGKVNLDGPVDAPSLTGELTLNDTRVMVRSEQDPVYKEVRVLAAGGPGAVREEPARGPGLLDRASVDLALTVPGDTWIRSPEIELDVQGWARLTKRSLEPLHISGDLTTRRGTVRLVGKRFTIRKGEAVLDGATEPDPVLDVEAIHPVADVVIVAHVTGRVSAPILQLESEPSLPEDEVVSYLFFGRPTDQLGSSEQGNVSLAAAGVAAGMALDELRQTLGNDLPVDTIDVELNEGEEPSRVEVGKYVTKDVFLRYGHTFGAANTEEIGVSYRIDDHWRIESTTSSDASAGADVYWTIDY